MELETHVHRRSRWAYPIPSPTTVPNESPLSSRPLNDCDSDYGDMASSLGGLTGSLVSPALGHAAHTGVFSNIAHSTATTPLAGQHQALQRHHQGRELALPAHSGQAAMGNMQPHPQYQLQQQYGQPQYERPTKWWQDIRDARTAANAMDRYKAHTRMFAHLKRDMREANLVGHAVKPSCWETPAGMDLLERIVEAGESLALFASADFGERSNSSRAINTKDYAHLLKMYGEAFWALYRQEFMDAMPQNIQDAMLSVQGLLLTRFETNAVIVDQLIKHVGLESNSAGAGAMINNISVVSANPVNAVSSKVTTSAAAAAKVLSKNNGKLSKLALGGAVGLWLLKKAGLLHLVPGIGGLLSRGGHSDEEGLSGGSSRGGRRYRSSPFGEERLMAGYEYADTAYKELLKAKRNIELLENDWRLGQLRLSDILGGPHPRGFEELDIKACEPLVFMKKQFGQA